MGLAAKNLIEQNPDKHLRMNVVITPLFWYDLAVDRQRLVGTEGPAGLEVRRLPWPLVKDARVLLRLSQPKLVEGILQACQVMGMISPEYERMLLLVRRDSGQ